MYPNHQLRFQNRISEYFSYQLDCNQLKTIKLLFFSFQFSTLAHQAMSPLSKEADFYHLQSSDMRLLYPF
jgi:hypothetical protein